MRIRKEGKIKVKAEMQLKDRIKTKFMKAKTDESEK